MGESESEIAVAADEALTHVDGAGRARMVDVTEKSWTQRRAVARCHVELGEEALTALAGGGPRAAEALGAARLAGIQAAKHTSELVPLCHRLTGSGTDVHLVVDRDGIEIECTAVVVGPTGVEMEALTGCAMAALAVVALVLPADPAVSIGELALWEKSGGRSGTWVRCDFSDG